MKSKKSLNGKFNVKLLAKLIIEKRTKENISLRAAGESCGISFPTLHRIETEKPCSVEYLTGVCNWLGITIQSLYNK